MRTAQVILLVLSCPLPGFGNTLRVERAGAGDFTDIQAAIDAAAPGDVVLVAPGEYEIRTPLSFRGKDLTVRAEAGPAGTAIVMASDPEDREYSSVVVFENGEGETATLAGFTLRGGQGSKSTGCRGECPRRGGGVICRQRASPTVRGCLIVDNVASEGGGVYIADASPRFVDCAIRGNRLETERFLAFGAGVACVNSSPTFENCTIAENLGAMEGGGMYCEVASPTLTECSIHGNAAQYGGGVSFDSSPGRLERCTIARNAADFGAGIICRSSAVLAQECTVSQNAGGRPLPSGILILGSPPPILSRCEFRGNAGYGVVCGSPVVIEGSILAGNAYAGLLCLRGSPRVTNCTIVANSAGVHALGASPSLVNCTITQNHWRAVDAANSSRVAVTNSIVWGNGGPVVAQRDSAAAVSYSCVEGGAEEGANNIDADPLFVSPASLDFSRATAVTIAGNEYALPDPIVAAGDYRLRPNSPAVDAGTADGAPRIDQDGCGRPCGGAVDMGAFERGACPAFRFWVRAPVIDAWGRGLVTVRLENTDGTAIPWARLYFWSSNPEEIAFVSPEAVTDARGSACNLAVAGIFPGDDVAAIRSSMVVVFAGQVLGVYPVRGTNVIVDGIAGFWAPPLRPFPGPGEQRLTGRVSTFVDPEVGEALSACSVDPTVAEISRGRIVAVELGWAEVEFTVEAHRQGRTFFVIGTVDRSVYEATVTFGAAMLRGDCNGDGRVPADVSDAVFFLRYRFAGGAEPPCRSACDANGDGALGGVTDAIYLLRHNFAAGPPPPPPFPECDLGSEQDLAIGCRSEPPGCS